LASRASRVGEGTWHGLGANACPGPKKERGPGCNVSAHGDVADQPPAKQPATTSPRPPQENPAGQYGGASVVSATQGAHSCSEPEPNQRPRATIPTRQWAPVLVDRTGQVDWGRWLLRSGSTGSTAGSAGSTVLTDSLPFPRNVLWQRVVAVLRRISCRVYLFARCWHTSICA